MRPSVRAFVRASSGGGGPPKIKKTRVLISGFSPIPYKIFTVASGVTGLAFIPFLVASFLGRGMRFFLIGFIVSKGGDNLEKKLRKYVEVIGWTGLSILFTYILFTYLGYF